MFHEQKYCLSLPSQSPTRLNPRHLYWLFTLIDCQAPYLCLHTDYWQEGPVTIFNIDKHPEPQLYLFCLISYFTFHGKTAFFLAVHFLTALDDFLTISTTTCSSVRPLPCSCNHLRAQVQTTGWPMTGPQWLEHWLNCCFLLILFCFVFYQYYFVFHCIQTVILSATLGLYQFHIALFETTLWLKCPQHNIS